MTNIIKVRFNKDGQPHGREYSYLTPVEVEVGDIVEMATSGKVAKGTVTQTGVPEIEVVAFKDKLKSIIGKENPNQDAYKCPRCGQNRMGYPKESNALSRRATIYICNACGTDEALMDLRGREPLPFDKWAMIQGFDNQNNN